MNGGLPNHILVVDDHVVARRIIMRILDQAGYDVTGVGSGMEALDVFQRERVDLAILDIGMPEIDGFTLLRMLRELPDGSNLPVIMLTASGRDEDVYAARAAHVDHFLTKPSSSQIIMQTVRDLLEGRA